MASTKLLARSGLLSVLTNVPVVEITPDYSTGDLVGGKQSLLNATKFTGGGGLIQSVVLLDAAKLSINKDVFFFDSDPTGTTFTENGALVVADADLAKLIGIAQITTWAVFSANAMGFSLDLAMPFVLASGSATLFAAIVERGTANYVAATDLTLRVAVMAA